MSKPYEVVTLLRDFRARNSLSRDHVCLVGARRVPDTCLARQYIRQRRKCIRIRRRDFENAIVPRRYPQDEIGNAHDFHPPPKDSLKSGFPQGRRDLFSSKLLITLHKPDLMCLKLFFIFISERSEISRDCIAQMLSSFAVDKCIHSLHNNRIMCMWLLLFIFIKILYILIFISSWK